MGREEQKAVDQGVGGLGLPASGASMDDVAAGVSRRDRAKSEPLESPRKRVIARDIVPSAAPVAGSSPLSLSLRAIPELFVPESPPAKALREESLSGDFGLTDDEIQKQRRQKMEALRQKRAALDSARRSNVDAALGSSPPPSRQSSRSEPEVALAGLQQPSVSRSARNFGRSPEAEAAFLARRHSAAAELLEHRGRSSGGQGESAVPSESLPLEIRQLQMWKVAFDANARSRERRAAEAREREAELNRSASIAARKGCDKESEVAPGREASVSGSGGRGISGGVGAVIDLNGTQPVALEVPEVASVGRPERGVKTMNELPVAGGVKERDGTGLGAGAVKEVSLDVAAVEAVGDVTSDAFQVLEKGSLGVLECSDVLERDGTSENAPAQRAQSVLPCGMRKAACVRAELPETGIGIQRESREVLESARVAAASPKGDVESIFAAPGDSSVREEFTDPSLFGSAGVLLRHELEQSIRVLEAAGSRLVGREARERILETSTRNGERMLSRAIAAVSSVEAASRELAATDLAAEQVLLGVRSRSRSEAFTRAQARAEDASVAQILADERSRRYAKVSARRKRGTAMACCDIEEGAFARERAASRALTGGIGQVARVRNVDGHCDASMSGFAGIERAPLTRELYPSPYSRRSACAATDGTEISGAAGRWTGSSVPSDQELRALLLEGRRRGDARVVELRHRKALLEEWKATVRSIRRDPSHPLLAEAVERATTLREMTRSYNLEVARLSVLRESLEDIQWGLDAAPVEPGERAAAAQKLEEYLRELSRS